MPYPRKLPPRAALRRLYVEDNLSFAQIAERYGAKPDTVRHTLERDARADGVAWPLKAYGTGRWLRRKSLAIHAGRDECRNLMVAAEIREALEEFGLTQTEFGRRAGISQSQISRILSSGEAGYCRRETAQKVERTVSMLERGRAISRAKRRAA